jgi:hypothetical protein
VRDQKWTLLTNPATELASIIRDDKGVAFLFSQETSNISKRRMSFFPRGKHDEVTSQRGKHLFYTYVLTPPEAQATQK